jgi:toxin ParE1/3/4
VADYRLSRRAAADLRAIAKYTIDQFGVAQARAFRDSLKSCFEELAQNNEMGRRAEQLAPGLRRFEHKAHIVFYTVGNEGVYIVRILHSRMDVRRHL